MTEKKHEPAKQEKQPGNMTGEDASRIGGQKGGQRERDVVEKGHQVDERHQSTNKPSGQKSKH